MIGTRRGQCHKHALGKVGEQNTAAYNIKGSGWVEKASIFCTEEFVSELDENNLSAELSLGCRL